MNDSLDTIWEAVLAYHKDAKEIEQVIFDNFYSETKLIRLTDSVATITVPNNPCKFILNGDVDKIQDSFKQITGKDVSIHFVVGDEQLVDTPKLVEQHLEEKVFDNGLRSDYTFDNFVVGPCNRESHAASLATAINPGKYYNPLFIYGNSGLGKTHLLHALGNYVIDHFPELKVKYIPCMDFVNSYIQSIKDGTIDDFNKLYRNVDILLFDDIQFLAGKEKSHEVFFHIFNDLINNKKQVVLTSDCHPDELKGLENRLVSRFAQGLSVGIDSPEFETALAILQKKISFKNDSSTIIEDDVLNYIASRFSCDIRHLEGALNRLLFFSISNNEANEPINLDLALKAFKHMDYSLKPGEELTLEKIKNVVADYYGLTRQQIISKNRTSNIANARHIAIYLCRKHLDMPFTKIGEGFGKRDHSTVMSSYEKVNKLLKTNEDYKLAIAEIEKQIINK